MRSTTENDFYTTEHITRESFWNVYRPGCVEHLILHSMRKSSAHISRLDLVAVFDNKIIGHIISTRAIVVDALKQEHEILCVGPFAVLPEYQKRGIGSKLMNESIRIAKNLGYAGMILFGNPEYYHRFGFRNAQEYGITTKDGLNFEPLMVLELQNKGLDGVKGRFYEGSSFDTDPAELLEFEKRFPHKEKLKTNTQFES
ncbi:MAG: N-acetyltransferase [Bacteroidota bacterium]